MWPRSRQESRAGDGWVLRWPLVAWLRWRMLFRPTVKDPSRLTRACRQLTRAGSHATIFAHEWEVSEVRTVITLACSECKRRNYTTSKNKKNDPNRLERRKYCRWCRTHTVHRETR